MEHDKEQKHFRTVIKAFRQYEAVSKNHLHSKRNTVRNSLGDVLGKSILERLNSHEELVEKNAQFLRQVVENAVFLDDSSKDEEKATTQEDHEKVRSTLRFRLLTKGNSTGIGAPKVM